MRRLFGITIVALGLVVTAMPTARALDPQALRQDLTAALNRGLSAYSTEPFLFTGIETTAQGAAVRVKITDLALPLPELGGRLDFGDLAFTLADAPPGVTGPDGAIDHRYQVSEVTTDSRAAMVDGQNNQTALINYSIERLTGVWSTALRSFLDIDMAVDRLEVVVPEENLGFAIDRLTGQQRSAGAGDGLTDLNGEARAAGLRMISPQFGTVRIGEILADYQAHGQSLAGVQALNQALEEMGDPEASADRGRIAAILERLELVNILPRGFIERVTVTDVNYLDAAQQPLFHLDVLEFDVAGGDLHLALGYGSLGLRMAGLRAALPGSNGGVGSPLDALTPENLGMIASVERFPVQAWWRSVLNGLVLTTSADALGSDADAIGAAMGSELLAAINEAGTVLRLDRLDVESPTGRLVAEGKFHVDPATAMGVRGRMDLAVTGLDDMIAAANGLAQSGQYDPSVQSNMMFLMLLKGMVRRELGPDGKPIDRLEIVVTPAGEVLLNGQPFSMAPPQ